MKQKVSIIVPIYNSELYLNKCIESLLNQTYSNIEIVLINDGSTDNSENICNEYRKNDNRIEYYYKKNEGVAIARNYGIKKASGEYIMFVDSDDYISLDYIKSMLDAAVKNQSDLVTSDYTEVTNGIELRKSAFTEKEGTIVDLNKEEYMSLYLKSAHFNSSCRKLISKDLIKKNKLQFISKLTYGEDMLFSFELYINSSKPIYVINYGYYYLMNDNSAMHRSDLSSFEKHYSNNIYIVKYIKDKYSLSEEHINCLEYKTYVTFNKISRRVCNSNFNFSTKREFINKQLKEYKVLLNNKNIYNYCNWKQKISLFLLKNRLVGLFIFIKLLFKA